MAKKRRAQGEGSVDWQPKLGVHRARLYVPKKYRHLHGNKTHLSFYAKRESDAIAKRDAARETMRESQKGKEVAFGDHLSSWLASLAALGSVSEITLQDYRYYSERFLIPGLGGVALSDMTAEHLDLLYVRLTEQGVGARTVNHVHSTARVALQRAVKKRLIPYNPAKDADPPRYSTDEREYAVMSWEDVRRFFAAAEGDRFEALWKMAVLSGPRPHELRALKWEDLTLPESGEGHALIWRSAVELKGEPPKVRNSTKTKKRRFVPLLAPVVSALVAHKARQNHERLAKGEAWVDLGLVFPTTAGTVMSRRNLSERHLKPILEKADLPKETRLYDLRHTFGTLWREDGKLLQKIMGHARYETTANRYIHPSDEATNNAMKRFGGGL